MLTVWISSINSLLYGFSDTGKGNNLKQKLQKNIDAFFSPYWRKITNFFFFDSIHTGHLKTWYGFTGGFHNDGEVEEELNQV